MPRERIATRSASQKLTPRLSVPVATSPATHHPKPALPSVAQPRVLTAAANWPVDSVTCRTSIGSPTKASSTGTRPSMKPSDTLAASPEILARHQADQRSARAAPSRATAPGWWASALSSRW